MENTLHESIESRVNVALDSVRQYLQADGGDIALVEITDDHVVKVRLLGACCTCDMSYQTLKLGVETTIKRNIPEIKEVVAVD
ncbi:MAG: hypothetical protein RIS47_1684 [Bacteroidota bacterium]|jgi:Fe-S cluster biogenesis protein NfuA